MKKRSTAFLAVLLAAVLLAAVFLAGLVFRLESGRELSRRVLEEGPWSNTNTWATEDSDSYLVCTKEDGAPFAVVTAYFRAGDSWQGYELNAQNRCAYLDRVENGVNTSCGQGEMKFDGTTFTLCKLDPTLFGKESYRYRITGQTFSPD